MRNICELDIHFHGVTRVNGRVIVRDAAKARKTAAEFRTNASDLDEQSSASGNFRRQVLTRVARDLRSLADDIDNQCDRHSERVSVT